MLPRGLLTIALCLWRYGKALYKGLAPSVMYGGKSTTASQHQLLPMACCPRLAAQKSPQNPVLVNQRWYPATTL